MPKPRSCLIWAKKREKRGGGGGARAVITRTVEPSCEGTSSAEVFRQKSTMSAIARRDAIASSADASPVSMKLSSGSAIPVQGGLIRARAGECAIKIRARLNRSVEFL